MTNTNLIVGNDGSNSLVGTGGRDLIYGFDPEGPQGNVGSITATRVAQGLVQPTFVGAPPNDLERLFIVEREGRIKILDLGTGEVLPDLFLDVSAEVSTEGEGGLLGLAFDPDFAVNGYFYVNLINTSGDTEIRRYQVSDNDRNLADASTKSTVITIDQPHNRFNHKAGWLGFGPDGFLYAASGDGGGPGDPNNNGQNVETLLGKMLRLDVRSDSFPGDASRNYAIPADNPFVGIAGADEIYALGLRNPWRNSFDRGLGDLFIADVGQNTWEEVNFGALGANYGWDRFEGSGIFSPDTPLGPGILTDPIHQYDHSVGHSITGGYVYRGSSEGLQGHYFFADYVDDKLFTMHFDGTEWVVTDRTAQLVPDVPTAITNLASFGEDGAGNLYLVDILGEVFRLVPVVTSADQGDVLRGGGGDDMIFGGSGADEHDGGLGDDTMLGGLGDDIYRVDRPTDMVVEVANEGIDTVFAASDYTLPAGSAVEHLRTSAGATGLRLTGNGFDNTILGGPGDDTLDGGVGADLLRGRLGDDRYHVDDAGDAVAEKSGQGIDTVWTTLPSYSLAISVENLRYAGVGNFTGIGNALANAITGRAGDDTLIGYKGADALNGGGGGTDVASYAGAKERVTASLADPESNTGYAAGDSYSSIEGLRGSAHADTLTGDDGDNLLNGGGGPDRLSGGIGNDTFEFDTLLVARRIVTIEDFMAGADRIALAHSIFTQAGAVGPLGSNAFHVGNAAHDADDRIIYSSATGALLYDADGLGGQAAVGFARVSAGLSLSAADIRVV